MSDAKKTKEQLVAELQLLRGRLAELEGERSRRRMAEQAVQPVKDELEARVAQRTEELLATHERLRLITDSLPAVIAYVDTERRYQFNNATYERWFGVPREEIRGRHVRDLLGEENYRRIQGQLEQVLKGERVTGESWLTLPDGDTRWIHATLVPDIGPNGEVQGFYALVNDMTEQKRAEQELRRAERLASIGTLAAGVAHEINNPVGVILLAAQVGLASEGDSAVVEKALNDIVKSARRCRRIVDNVLKFARGVTSEKRPSDLNEVVGRASESLREQAAAHGTILKVSLDPNLSPVVVNPVEIEQVVTNLVQNSLEAGAGRVVVRTLEAPDLVRLSVQDDGPGIPEEHRRRMFDPFYTGRSGEGGTGLGLSIIHGIVEDHHGTIALESAPGTHTTIVVSLPKRPASGRPTNSRTSQRQQGQRTPDGEPYPPA